MRLYLNQASPYARLVRVVLEETGLATGTTLHFLDPWASPPEILDRNPAARVPVLELDDGTSLVESGCICDYLVARSDRPDLAAVGGDGRAGRARVLGLGRAAIDCAFGAVLLERELPSAALAGRWRGALPRIADALDAPTAAGDDDSPPDLADLTLAVAFEYVDFRLPDVDWRRRNRSLARRVARMGERASMIASRPG